MPSVAIPILMVFCQIVIYFTISTIIITALRVFLGYRHVSYVMFFYNRDVWYYKQTQYEAKGERSIV